MNISSIRLLPAPRGIAAAAPVTAAGDRSFRGQQRILGPRPRAPHGEFLPVTAESGRAASILVANAFLAQHIAQETVPAERPTATLLAAYRSVPPAAFEGLNYRTLA